MRRFRREWDWVERGRPQSPSIEQEWRENRVRPLSSSTSLVFSTFAMAGSEMELQSRQIRYRDDDTFVGQTSETGLFGIKVDHRLEDDALMSEHHYLHYNCHHSLLETICMAYPTIINPS